MKTTTRRVTAAFSDDATSDDLWQWADQKKRAALTGRLAARRKRVLPAISEAFFVRLRAILKSHL